MNNFNPSVIARQFISQAIHTLIPYPFFYVWQFYQRSTLPCGGGLRGWVKSNPCKRILSIFATIQTPPNRHCDGKSQDLSEAIHTKFIILMRQSRQRIQKKSKKKFIDCHKADSNESTSRNDKNKVKRHCEQAKKTKQSKIFYPPPSPLRKGGGKKCKNLRKKKGGGNAKISAREGENKVWMPQKSYGFAGFVSESHNDRKFRLPQIAFAMQGLQANLAMTKLEGGKSPFYNVNGYLKLFLRLPQIIH